MIRLTVISLLLSIMINVYPQIDASEAMEKRDSIFNLYQRHSDTITKNTWLNIMQKNKYLNEIVFYDSLIFESTKSDERLDSLLLVLNQQLITSQKNLKSKESEAKQAEQTMAFYKKMYVMLLIVALLFLVIIIVLIVLTAWLNKSVKAKDKQVKSYYTELNKARQEIENSRKTENQLASEINKLKKQINSNIENPGDVVEKLNDEKLMLENQMIEIKKAYELEVNKRMEIEASIVGKNQDVDSDELKELKIKIASLHDENRVLSLEVEKMKLIESELNKSNAEIEELKKNLEGQSILRQSAEERLSELINKIKLLTNDF